MRGDLCPAAFRLSTSLPSKTHERKPPTSAYQLAKRGPNLFRQKKEADLMRGRKPASKPLPKGRAISIKPGSDLRRNFGGGKE